MIAHTSRLDRRFRLGLLVVAAILSVFTVSHDGHRGRTMPPVFPASEKCAPQLTQHDHGKHGRRHAMYAPGTRLRDEYVVANPGWRWPNPNGDNPPKGETTEVTYSYSNFDAIDVPCDDLRQATEEALQLWAEYAPIHFVEVEDTPPCPIVPDLPYSVGGAAHLRIGAHYIDSQSGVLAHAYFPYSSTDRLAGDIHFDVHENWQIGPGDGVIDVLEVMVHELGHALGLRHEGRVDAIMNPFYGGRYSGFGTAFLLPDDIDGIRAIYGEGQGSVTPLPDGNCGPCEACVATDLLHLAGHTQWQLPTPLGGSLFGVDSATEILNGLRGFRDNVLNVSGAGRELVGLYYDHSAELASLFANHPRLARSAMDVLARAYPAILAAETSGGAISVDAETLMDGLDVLEELRDLGTDALDSALERVVVSVLNHLVANGEKATIHFAR